MNPPEGKVVAHFHCPLPVHQDHLITFHIIFPSLKCHRVFPNNNATSARWSSFNFKWQHNSIHYAKENTALPSCQSLWTNKLPKCEAKQSQPKQVHFARYTKRDAIWCTRLDGRSARTFVKKMHWEASTEKIVSQQTSCWSSSNYHHFSNCLLPRNYHVRARFCNSGLEYIKPSHSAPKLVIPRDQSLQVCRQVVQPFESKQMEQPRQQLARDDVAPTKHSFQIQKPAWWTVTSLVVSANYMTKNWAYIHCESPKARALAFPPIAIESVHNVQMSPTIGTPISSNQILSANLVPVYHKSVSRFEVNRHAR